MELQHVLKKILALSHGPPSVIVNCFQTGYSDSLGTTPARVGCRVVKASRSSIEGLTGHNVNFSACTDCGAVSGCFGVLGDVTTPFQFEPDDPRSILLQSLITETENGAQWGQQGCADARVIGMINVHRCMKMSETHTRCFCCGL
ncbi:unnamed protein product [Sphacelaria rigidula]